MVDTKLILGDCEAALAQLTQPLALTWCDSPFNVAKYYRSHNDDMPGEAYWAWLQRFCTAVRAQSLPGAAFYFMQREKHTHHVLHCLEASGWTFQNLIIWRKMSSAVPGAQRFGKHYQIIGFATNGHRPRVFNRLRINLPLQANEKKARPTGVYLTDVWSDIRELTAGYFAGAEPLRDAQGDRLHNQQSPLKLLTRIILSSTLPGDCVYDGFAGTATTAVCAQQLQRHSISVELDSVNFDVMQQRLKLKRPIDSILRFRPDYACTADIDRLWPLEAAIAC